MDNKETEYVTIDFDDESSIQHNAEYVSTAKSAVYSNFNSPDTQLHNNFNTQKPAQINMQYRPNAVKPKSPVPAFAVSLVSLIVSFWPVIGLILPLVSLFLCINYNKSISRNSSVMSALGIAAWVISIISLVLHVIIAYNMLK